MDEPETPEQRDPYLDDDFAAFPYVNGGLFADENIEIPRLGDEIFDLILNRASADFRINLSGSIRQYVQMWITTAVIYPLAKVSFDILQA